ncbi:hypothetical protein [Altericista sp. CCNU0014]|uniref:hypothetical protein n=1 Tax=Altericista sp. CCNU0014 TaxID=3082949 RepID=UPI0038506208
MCSVILQNWYKFYRSISDLQEYVLINQYELEIQHYAKSGGGFWIYRAYEAAEDAIALTSIETEITVADIYAGVSFKPALSTANRIESENKG